MDILGFGTWRSLGVMIHRAPADRSFEYYFSYENQWQAQRRRWAIPGHFYKSISRIALFVDGEEVPESDIRLRSGHLELLNRSIPISADSKAVAEIELNKRARISTFTQNLVLALVAVIPASITAASWYILKPDHVGPELHAEADTVTDPMRGQPLAYYDFYPVQADTAGRLYFDHGFFIEACRWLRESHDAKAASDLVYLVQSNGIDHKLGPAELAVYEELVNEYGFKDFSERIDEHREQILLSFKQIVNGIGETVDGTNMKIVLHDVRNPLGSVIAIKNPISGRKLGQPTTNFGLQLIKSYSKLGSNGASYISYPLALKNGERIKSSSIPIYDANYGLVAFICVNIKIAELVRDDPNYTERFIENFVRTNENMDIKEMVDAASK